MLFFDDSLSTILTILLTHFWVGSMAFPDVNQLTIQPGVNTNPGFTMFGIQQKNHVVHIPPAQGLKSEKHYISF